MRLNGKTEYYLIFDTNTLFQQYDKKADFTSFSFNATYNNVIDMINQLDIYDEVELIIPSVVWREMEQQIIDKHDESIENFKSTIRKKKFPEFLISENVIDDYSLYIKSKIEIYKTDLLSGLNRIIELPIATSDRFDSIVKRAFEKRPPFEGKDKKSDKGFKDALLWESILDFASFHSSSNIIFYSKDNAFGKLLINEFHESYSDSSLYICKDESEVKKQLENWAKEIDVYSYQPIDEYDENKELIDWINSENFYIQLNYYKTNIVEKGRLIVESSIELIDYDDIQEGDLEGKNIYLFDAILKVIYTLKDSTITFDLINSSIIVEYSTEEGYIIKEIYIGDD
ncbi:MAG: DUF4935 domain-containing protein [Firmicutes bacterium]|nr:DUF4935 domain-containing protein [Bacillota bacterium]